MIKVKTNRGSFWFNEKKSEICHFHKWRIFCHFKRGV